MILRLDMRHGREKKSLRIFRVFTFRNLLPISAGLP